MARKKPQAATYDIIIIQGDDFIFQIQLKDGQDNPIDITGCSYECKVRETAEEENVILSSQYRLVEPTKGLLEVHFKNEDTAKVDTDGDTYEDVSEYTYDVIQTSEEGQRTRVLQGMFYVSPGISYH